MKKERSLKKLIAISISLTIISIALIYSLLLYLIVHSTENQLMGSAMSSTLNGIMIFLRANLRASIISPGFILKEILPIRYRTLSKTCRSVTLRWSEEKIFTSIR